jgi:hypothetical protein
VSILTLSQQGFLAVTTARSPDPARHDPFLFMGALAGAAVPAVRQQEEMAGIASRGARLLEVIGRCGP